MRASMLERSPPFSKPEAPLLKLTLIHRKNLAARFRELLGWNTPEMSSSRSRGRQYCGNWTVVLLVFLISGAAAAAAASEAPYHSESPAVHTEEEGAPVHGVVEVGRSGSRPYGRVRGAALASLGIFLFAALVYAKMVRQQAGRNAIASDGAQPPLEIF
ncbi:hypothetical protein Efla_001449 [Eimeria flavescens]